MKSNIKFAMCFIYILLTITGCAITPSSIQKEPIENTAHLTIGDHLTINNTNENLILYDNKSALAGDGLYYASWRIGDAIPYENSDGDSVDLYSAQLYLLMGEFSNNTKAQENQESWLSKAESNYEISDEKEIDCSGQLYTMLTYTFTDKNNPYARGVSAFGLHDNLAVCIELTCQNDFEEDLTAILTEFLENCTYSE